MDAKQLIILLAFNSFYTENNSTLMKVESHKLCFFSSVIYKVRAFLVLLRILKNYVWLAKKVFSRATKKTVFSRAA
jgi:hypothetical protein